jgi:Acetyltransferase (GNAT) domain
VIARPDAATVGDALDGYGDARYVRSLDEFGIPRPLRRSMGWLLERQIPSAAVRDAIGPYPLFSCRRWHALGDDLDELEGELVSVALVADPLGEHTPELLERTFEVAEPFKEHYVAELGDERLTFVSPHHRRKAARALREVTIVEPDDPTSVLDTWVTLYGELSRRRGFSGLRAFSRKAFARQLRVPGMAAFEAQRDGTTVSIALWLRRDGAVYFHLGASAAEGYAVSASYALFWRALERFTDQRVGVILLGGGAGLGKSRDEGLEFFKRGWATSTVPAYFCGRILDGVEYEHLRRGSRAPETSYFPAYRHGELA